MTEEQSQALTEKLARIGYSAYEVLPGEDEILMLHVNGHFVGGALYAMDLPDAELKALIDEAVAVAGGQG